MALPATRATMSALFEEKGIPSVLDIGCGRGILREGYSGRWVGLDRSIEQLRHAGGARARSLTRFRCPSRTRASQAWPPLYMLYFFEEPPKCVREALRVLQPGGWFARARRARFDAPELAHVTPKEEMDSFAAEDVTELAVRALPRCRVHDLGLPGLRSAGP